VSAVLRAECISPARRAISSKSSKPMRNNDEEPRMGLFVLPPGVRNRFTNQGTKVVQIIYRQALDDRRCRRADSTLESRNPVL
jgi:hypothetical protein